MSKLEKLLRQARSSPENYRFSDICSLAEKVGFQFKRQKGSHAQYQHTVYRELSLNFQKIKNGQASSYQVRQLVSFIDDYNLDKE